MPLSEGLESLVDRIFQLRKNNPVLQRLHLPTDRKLIRQEVINYNCALNPDICVEPPTPGNATKKVQVTRKGGCCGRSK